MKTSYKVKLDSNFKNFSKFTMSDLAAALNVEAEKIMTDSQINYVPVITGDLRRTGFVEEPKIQPNKVTVTLGFGSNTIAYALAVHDAPASWGQGKNKYLLKPLQKAMPKFTVNISNTMNNRMKSRAKNFPGGKQRTWVWSA